MLGVIISFKPWVDLLFADGSVLTAMLDLRHFSMVLYKVAVSAKNELLQLESNAYEIMMG